MVHAGIVSAFPLSPFPLLLPLPHYLYVIRYLGYIWSRVYAM